ncbi:MAG: YicC/YloC family endoribonuclease [Acidobacteriota bacterium]|nr:YicC/YloC family endoribonuclease [Acidobacteriota bacterium]
MTARLRSMTGFGTASGESDRYRITVDVRSVNHRSLDLVVRTREPYRAAEKALRDLVKDGLSRGRVELLLDVAFVGQDSATVEVDQELARRVLEALERLAEGGRLGSPSAVDLLRVPGVISVNGGERDWQQEDEELLLEVASRALGELVAAREKEGAKLAAELDTGIGRLIGSLGELASRRETVVGRSKQALLERVSALLDGPPLDQGRLEQEVALLVEKSDVAEELDRLSAHIEHLGEAIAGTAAAGKRIDFLLQEILRELNTIGAKCRDLDMSRTVLEARLVSEQMREQVQNVE